MPRLKLLFDVSCLGYGALGQRHRTGLYRVAEAYLRELGQNPEVELGLYSSSGNRMLAKAVLRINGWKVQPWVGSGGASFLVLVAKSLQLAAYRLRLPLAGLTKGFLALAETFRAMTDRGSLSRWQAYLSPMEAAPASIARSNLVEAVILHDVIPLVLPEYYQDPEDPTRWFTGLWRSLEGADLIFTVSENTRQEALARSALEPKKVFVAPNAVDRTKYVPADRGETHRYFFALSTIEPRKRLDAILAGYKRYRRSGGTLGLVVGGAGKPPQQEPMAGLEFAGFVDQDSLPGLYQGCAGFLSLSDYEGFGLPVLEAMACGAPVILSRRSSHPEVAGDAGIYVDADDVASVADALHRLSDEAERSLWATRSLGRSALFSWTQTVTAVVDVIKEKALGG